MVIRIHTRVTAHLIPVPSLPRCCPAVVGPASSFFSGLWGIGLKEWKGAGVRAGWSLFLALSLPTVIVGDGNYLALPLFAEHGKTSRTGPLTNVYLSVGLPRGVQEGYDLFSLVGSMIRGMLRNARLGTFHGLRYTETNPSQPQSGIVYIQ